MKKKLLIFTSLMMILMLAGCGTSQEKKKASDLPQEITTNKFENKETSTEITEDKGNEDSVVIPDSYVDVLEDVSVNELCPSIQRDGYNIPINIYHAGEQYIHKDNRNDTSYGTFIYGEYNNESYRSFCRTYMSKNFPESETETIGNYIVYVKDMSSDNELIKYIYVQEIGAKGGLEIAWQTTNSDYRDEVDLIVQKNIDYIKEQLN